MSPGSIRILRDAMIALEADRRDAVLDVEALGIDLPLAARHGCRRDRTSAACGNSSMPAGLPSASRAIVPKNQKPVSATPMKSLPGVRKRKADSAPKSRDDDVSSSPPTNSSGPKRVSVAADAERA